jgi:hypothetical protein
MTLKILNYFIFLSRNRHIKWRLSNLVLMIRIPAFFYNFFD